MLFYELGLTEDILLVLALLVFTMILFISEVVRTDVAACLVLVLVGITDLVPAEQLFSGFSSDAVSALIGVMIMTAGLERSGVISRFSRWMIRLGSHSERRLSILLMVTSGLLSGLMRSVGAVALLLPTVTRISRRTGVSKSRLLMPLGFCAILGSVWTMVGSGPLILLNSLLDEVGGLTDFAGHEVQPFGFFDVAPIGLSLLAVGVIYFLLVGNHFLPKRRSQQRSIGDALEYFQRVYGIGGAYLEIRIPKSAAIANILLRDFEELLPPDAAVIAVKLGSKVHMPALRRLTLTAGAVIAVLGPREAVAEVCKQQGLRLSASLSAFAEQLNAANSGVCEVVVPPSSDLVGMDYKTLHMRREYETQVLAILRGQTVRRASEFKEVTLRPGDTLGMFCTWASLSALEKNPNFLIATTDFPRLSEYTGMMKRTLFFALLAFGLMFSGFNASISLLVGAMGMIVSGVVKMDEAYKAISWRTIFLISGLFPLGIAMQTTGTAQWLVSWLLSVTGDMPAFGFEVLFAVMATLFSLVISNVGATVILVPLAVYTADSVGISPHILGLIVAVGASNAFLLPTHQANALIVGSGRYQVSDFLKIGSMMTVLYWVVMIGIIEWFY